MDLNKKSVKQQGGAMIPQQPGMQQQPMGMQQQPQVDPQVMQITEVFSQSMNQGQQPQEIVMNLMAQQVDQNLIGQALMTMGYEQEMVMELFKQIEQSQRQQEPTPQEITNNPQQLARAESIQENAPAMDMNIDPINMAKSGIEIDPKNEGKFTAWAKSRGMTVKQAYNKVMSNTKAYPPSVVKMANFAKNAAGWNKAQDGVEIQKLSPDGKNIITEKDGVTILKDNPWDNQDIQSQIKLLQQQAAIAKAQALHNAKKALLNEQKKGGEFEPHFMYKGDRKIRARDYEAHLRLKKAGYGHDAPKAQAGGEGVYDTPISNETPGSYIKQMGGDGVVPTGYVPIGFNPDPQVQAKLEQKFSDDATANQLVDFINVATDKTKNKLVGTQDNGYLAPNPMYLNPAAFGDQTVNVNDIINTTTSVVSDFLGDDGAISNYKQNKIDDKATKLANSEYKIKFDVTKENEKAFNDYLTQWKYENPEKDILGNLVEESEKIADEISTENIDVNDPEVKKFLNMNIDNLSSKGKQLYENLKDKFFPNGEPSKKYGGSNLPKAQFNIPDFMYGKQESEFDLTGGGFNPYTDDLAEFMKNAGQTDYIQDTELVNRAAIDDGTYGDRTQEQRPEASTVPLPEPAGITDWDKDGDGIPDTIDIDGGDGTGEGVPGTEGSPSADELRSRINKPTVKRKRNTLFAIEDYPNTAGGNLFAKGSNAIYQYNRIKNDITEAKNNKQAEKDLKTIDTIADNTYGVMYDMNFKRGQGELINPGGFGSEGDRTTGLYMNEGGGVNNEGFKALPDYVQHNILKNMQTGGGTAAIDTAAILSGLPSDFIQSTMGKQLLGIQPNTATNLMDIYDKAKNISSVGEGLDFFTSVKKKDLKDLMDEAGINKNQVRDYVYDQDFYNDSSWATRQAIKLAMKTKGLKQGGETVEVDSRMLAKLIAAGADIEKL